MAYIEPKGLIKEATETNDVSRLVIEFDRMDSGPIAPAGLYIDPKTGTEQFQLHKHIDKKAQIHTFETYRSTHPLPKIGSVYSYRGWWLQKAMDAALDEKETWEKVIYPDNGNHEHCLFSWETIASYVENNEAYHSNKYGWISCESYLNFIKNDIYRLRIKNA